MRLMSSTTTSEEINQDTGKRVREPLITNIQRYSLQDGPGLRTTIFLKGCPLRCPWCHNPETQSVKPEINHFLDKCTGCGKCAEVCPTGATYIEKERGEINLRFDRNKCTGCGECVKACLYEARQLVGTKMTMDEVIKEAVSDRPFFQNSGGGVTISGGEPLFFPEYTTELAKRLKWEEAVHLAIDTSCYCRWSHLAELVPLANLFLCDIKTMDPVKYKEIIKGDLKVILTNIENLVRAGANIRIRLAIIPDFNNSKEDFEAYASYIATLPGKIVAVDILPFHSYAENKYALLGRLGNYKYRDFKSLFGEDVVELLKIMAPVARAHKFECTVGGLSGVTAQSLS